MRRFVRNSIFSGLGTLATLLLGFVFAGLTIRFLGEARGGFLITIQALLGLNLLLGGYGLGTPAVRRIAVLHAEHKLATARSVVGAVVVVNLATTLPIALLIIAFFPLVFDWTRLDPIYRADALSAVTFVCVAFELGQISLSWQYIYQSLQRYDVSTALTTVFGLLSGISGIIILKLAPSMTAISISGLVVIVLRLLCDGYFAKRLLSGLPLLGWRWDEIRPMLKFGGWTYLGAVGGLLFTNADRLILTSFLGSAALPYYAVPQRLYQQFHTALAGQSEFLFPMFSSLGKNATAQMHRVEDRLRWFIALAGVIGYVGLALVGPIILAWLISPEFAQLARIPLYLACVQGFLNAQNIIPFYTSWAAGYGAPNAVAQIVNGCLTLITAWLLIPAFGYIGASFAQLWIGLVVVAQIIWVRQLLYSPVLRWSWLKSYLSPLLLAVAWIGFSGLGAIMAGTDSVGYLLLVVVGSLVGLTLVWFIETTYFPQEGRWSTLLRAAKIPLRRRTSGMQVDPGAVITIDKSAIE